MAYGLPKQPYVYRKSFFQDVAGKEESLQEKPVDEEHEEEPPPQPTIAHESDIEIHINKKKALAFLLSGILFYTVATSLSSFGDVFTDALTLNSEKMSVEASPGSDLSLPLLIENKSLFKKDVNVRIDSPWISEICAETRCFQSGNLILRRRSETNLSVNVRVPPNAQSDEVGVIVQGDKTLSFTFKVNVLSQEKIFLAMKGTEETKAGKRIVVTLKNEGNKPSKVFLNLKESSEGWRVALSESIVALKAGEEKDIIVDSSQDRDSGTFSSVLTATTEEGSSATLLLTADARHLYDFSVSSEPRYMVSKEGTTVSFTLKNEGNVPDTYAVSLTSYPSDWSLNLSEKEVTLNAGEQKGIMLTVTPSSDRNTNILLNITSQSNKVSKNLTLSLLMQKAAQASVLAEHFTATWCFVCPIAERAIERVVSENPSLILLNYHLQDAITTPGSEKRAQGLYAMGMNVSTVIFNGTKMVPFLSGGEDALYQRYTKLFSDLISTPQTFEIYLSGFGEGDKGTLNARIKPSIQKNYDVYFVIFRDPFKYKNSTRRYIVRDVLGPEKIFNGNEANLSHSFTIAQDAFGNSGLAGLGVVVIVQDPVTKMIWQAAVYRFG
jgi:thiol-disulfide isomerase/thioredoxin